MLMEDDDGDSWFVPNHNLEGVSWEDQRREEEELLRVPNEAQAPPSS